MIQTFHIKLDVPDDDSWDVLDVEEAIREWGDPDSLTVDAEDHTTRAQYLQAESSDRHRRGN